MRQDRPRGVLAATLIAACSLAWSGCGDEYPVAEFIGQLRVGLNPQTASPGDPIKFFVAGEPPIRLRAREYLDLLSAEGEPLYRLVAARTGHTVLRYPLPQGYSPETSTVPLVRRQTVQLPRAIAPGRYHVQGAIVDRRDNERGSPEAVLQVR